MGDLVAVEFIKPDGCYYPGDKAGFVKKLADALVNHGKAVYVKGAEPQRRSREHAKVTK